MVLKIYFSGLYMGCTVYPFKPFVFHKLL